MSEHFEEEYDENGNIISGSRFNEDGNIKYEVIQERPKFKDGEKSLMKFLSENITYPRSLRRKGITGSVFLAFVIETDGRVVDVELVKGAHPLFEEEAMRVVNSTDGLWSPGKMRGKSVRVKYNLPITFALQ